MSSLLAAALGALLFAVHPLQVESVAWISEIRGLLCGLFALLALWQYVEYADARRSNRLRAMLYAGATAALVLGLLSKPAAAAVPLMAGVLGVGLLHRRLTVVFLEISPWIVCAGVAGAITKQLQPGGATAYVPSLVLRPVIALDAISFYVGKLFVPRPLIADYGRTPQFVLGGASFQIGWILLPALLVLLVLVKQRRMPLVGLALFVAWLAPVLGLVPFDFQRISTVADRYVYVAMLGPALIVAWVVQRWWSRPLLAAAAVTAGILAGLSFQQLSVWRNSKALFTYVLKINPRSALAQYHLGYLASFDGRYDEAIDWYRKSLESRPDLVETHIQLARALYASHRIDEASRVLREARPVVSDTAWALVQETLAALEAKQLGLSVAAEQVKQGVAEEAVGRLAEARRHYEEAIRIEPGDAPAHYNLGNLSYAERNWPQAVKHYEAALKFQPEYAQARANLGAALLQLRRFREAITQERAALIIDPTLSQARMMLGQALLLSGLNNEAAAEFRQALSQVEPGSAQAASLRDWLRRAEGP